jgi:hypothetical protein
MQSSISDNSVFGLSVYAKVEYQVRALVIIAQNGERITLGIEKTAILNMA